LCCSSAWAKHCAAQKLLVAMTGKEKLTEEFKAILRGNSIPEEVWDFLGKKNCLSSKNFANWVDRASELTAVTDEVASVKDDRSVLANLKQAWREVEATVSRAVKRAAEGLSEVPLDEPLPQTVVDSIQQNWMAKYSFDLEGRYRPSHSLLGRVRREFERDQPTMISVLKVKSLFDKIKQQDAKRHRATEAVTIVVEGVQEEENSARDSFRSTMMQMEVLANTWAIAGCYFVDVSTGLPTTSSAGIPVLYCTWPEATKYYRDIRSKAEDMLEKYVERSVITYVIQVEEHHRQWALEQLRVKANKLSFGQALVLSLKEQRNAWYDYSVVLISRRESAPGSSSSNAGGHSAPVTRPGVSSSVADISRKPATGSHTKAGVQICKKFNDRRGCPQTPCKSGQAHCCDIQLASGRICEGKHSREQHREDSHGKWQIRP
jgi:hypothetical protein